MDNKERAAATRFIEETPAVIFNSVVNRYNPDLIEREMRTLLHKTKKDSTGEATRGLQQAVFDWILRHSLVSRESMAVGPKEYRLNVDIENKQYFSGWQMTELLNKPQTQAIIKTILTKEQQNRLTLVQNSAIKLDLIRKIQPATEGIIADATGWILEVLGSIGGAQLGRAVAGR